MTVNGKELVLPYETLLIAGTEKPCVRGSPPLQQVPALFELSWPPH